MMPQKKNPDSLELLRGKSGRTFGNVSEYIASCSCLTETIIDDRFLDDFKGSSLYI